MSAGLNQVVLIGNLTEDPELKHTDSGVARTNFTIAVDRRYRDANDKLQKAVTFVPITVWRNQAENCEKYLDKGSPVAVTGRLEISNYEDSEGTTRTWAGVVARNVRFLGFSQDNGGSDKSSGGGKPSEDAPDDEEIPF